MNLDVAEKIAFDLVHEHCPPGWIWVWNRARVEFGRCSYETQTIYLSRPLTLINDESTFRTVMLHEIAHVLAGINGDQGHGRAWKLQAIALGIPPERCVKEATPIDGDVISTCPRCGASFRQFKVTYALFKKNACRRCYGKDKSIVRFIVTQNGEPVPCPPKPKPRRRRRR